MIASLHIVRYPSLWRTFANYRHTKKCLEATPGVRFFHEIIVAMSAVPAAYAPGQTEFPRLRNIFPFHMTFAYRLEPRTALLVLWEDADALERFLFDSPLAQHWSRVASEAWHVRLRTAFAKGDWRDGDRRFPETEKQPLSDGPMLSVVHVRPTSRALRAFWPTMQAVIAASATQPGLVAMVTGVDRVLFSGTSMSFWASANDALTFGYRTPIHADALKRANEDGWLSTSFMARFTPYASSGTFHGLDPLAAMLAPAE